MNTAAIETARLAAQNAYARADRAAENNEPAEQVEALYARAQDAYRELVAARSQVAA